MPGNVATSSRTVVDDLYIITQYKQLFLSKMIVFPDNVIGSDCKQSALAGSLAKAVISENTAL